MTDYDELHFVCKASPVRHPYRWETIAYLYGLSPQPFSSAKILELGCATGESIIPIASLYPESQCTGIDSAEGQIKAGEQACSRLKLSNCTLRTESFETADFGDEKFDYIICHGIFSWIEQETRARLFELTARHLSASGVFFLSFNCNPGWEFRNVLINFIKGHISDTLDLQAQILRARELCNFLEEALVDSTEAYGMGLKKEAKNAKGQSDSYICHELLNNRADATSFSEFLLIAESFGFAYLADARFERVLSRRLSSLPLTDKGQATLSSIGEDFNVLEGLLDYAYPTTLRNSLLVFQQDINRDIDPLKIKDLYLSGAFRLSGLEKGIAEEGTTEFETPSGQILEIDFFPLKAFLLILGESYPKCLAFDQIVGLINSRFDRSLSEEDLDMLCSAALNLFSQKSVELFPLELPIRSDLGERPKVFESARLQAEKQDWVTNIRNEFVLLDPFQQALIKLCDGESSLNQIVDQVYLMMKPDGDQAECSDMLADQEQARKEIKEACSANIQIFADSSLLLC